MSNNARPGHSYRAARRNRCLRADPKTTWGQDWYVPQHRARYRRGYPGYRRTPGVYPRHMLAEMHSLIAYKDMVASVYKAALAAFGGINMRRR